MCVSVIGNGIPARTYEAGAGKVRARDIAPLRRAQRAPTRPLTRINAGLFRPEIMRGA